ncbi:asparagine synthase (glutamine-hydrolyzing) [Aridibaculum aurantiacum]|uniref:asparagine synthase (glutamine-hydrolyzing) n=1 Tax=Aridibaculum aurantiacum TaxID=2810307 RepID=UPI001A975412|nr:asparagine synthase (glutamine-hydrolyzing) [Aridibaculum aurantiacum]
MCGIVGVFNYKKDIKDQERFINWSLQTMQHRGPDSNGVWSHDNYIAGFVRLAIRDLSANGHQPMVSQCGNYVLSFNGEIYNTERFRQQLQKLGVSFRSTTDTEVLLYALIHFGVEAVLEKFDGIFAFAFYNRQTNELLLTRDRTGIKPLYIGHSQQGLVYSSQYDHIINHPYISNNALNAAALGSYLQLGYVPENTGAVDGTFLLPHGYYLRVDTTGYTMHRYYNYPLDNTTAPVVSFEELLQQTIQQQLVSDVPVGTFMSGGVDSPLVSYYAKKQKPLSSFTIGVDDPSIDESKAAAAYASLFKTDHHTLHITEQDLLATIDDNTAAFTEPFADFSSIPTLLLSKFARTKVTVAFSGDGGDELFWGYPRNMRMLQEGMMFRKSKLQRVLALGKQKLVGGKRILRKRHLEVEDFPAYYYRSLFITGAEQSLDSLFEQKAEEAFFYKKIYKENNILNTGEAHVMNILRKMEMDLHLQRILLKVDRASMFHSLEVRVPLLSNDIIQYSTGLGYSDCVKNGQGKYNLKQLLIKHSNEQLVLQPKKGFVIPIGNWLRKELKSDVQQKLLGMPQALAPLFKKQEVEKILREHNSGSADWGWLIWSMYSLVNWHAYHLSKFS